jgi:hypothetical protein
MVDGSADVIFNVMMLLLSSMQKCTQVLTSKRITLIDNRLLVRFVFTGGIRASCVVPKVKCNGNPNSNPNTQTQTLTKDPSRERHWLSRIQDKTKDKGRRQRQKQRQDRTRQERRYSTEKERERERERELTMKGLVFSFNLFLYTCVSPTGQEGRAAPPHT